MRNSQRKSGEGDGSVYVCVCALVGMYMYPMYRVYNLSVVWSSTYVCVFILPVQHKGCSMHHADCGIGYNNIMVHVFDICSSL